MSVSSLKAFNLSLCIIVKASENELRNLQTFVVDLIKIILEHCSTDCEPTQPFVDRKMMLS